VREAFVSWTLPCGTPSRGIEPPWHRRHPKPRYRRVRTRGRFTSVRHPSLADLEVADVLRPTVLTTSGFARLMSSQLLPTLYAGLPRFHHRVLTLSVDVRRDLDVLSVSVCVNLETELFVTLLWSDCRPNSGPVSGRPQRTPPSSGGPQESRRRLLAGTDGRDAQCNNSVPPCSSVVGDAVQLCERWSPPRMPPLRLCTRTPRPAGETRRQLSPRGGRAPGGLLCARSQPVLYE
jgi:hypothetical protein